MARASILMLLMILITPVANAHLLKVFAFAEGNRITGSTYFFGGAPASGANIQVMGADDRLLATIEPDAAGDFSYQATSSEDHVIVAKTGDGHMAKWLVTAAELTGNASATAAQETPPRTDPDTGSDFSHSQLSSMVEAAVARQVRPLREQLIAQDEKVRLQDIIGGIGYILGIFGLAAWWQQKRRADS